MDPAFGQMLKSIRHSQALSLTDLARLTHFSRQQLANVESGRRRPTPPLVHAVDEALQANGLLVQLAAAGEDDTVYRRTLVKALGTLAGVGAAAPAAVSESIRQSLQAAAGVTGDAEWGEIAASYGRGFLTEPLAAFASRAVGDLMALSAQPGRHTAHGVRIAMVYGSSLASLGDPVQATRWYETAVTLADHTGDAGLRAWSRARFSYRTFYEGGPEDRVMSATELPVALGRPSTALIEAQAVRAHVYASRGSRRDSLAALNAAYGALESAADQDPLSIFSMPEWRLAIAASWVYTALGDAANAEKAQLDAEQLPGQAARWRAQVDMHRAWGLVLHGDINEGSEKALLLLQAEPSRVIRGLGTRVYNAVPMPERTRPAVRELEQRLTAS